MSTSADNTESRGREDLYERVERLHRSLIDDPAAPTDDGEARRATSAHRLSRSVLRPLAEILGSRTPLPPPGPSAEAPGLDVLAREATALRVRDDGPPQLLEATAALQDLACAAAGEDGEALRRELSDLQAELPPTIEP